MTRITPPPWFGFEDLAPLSIGCRVCQRFAVCGGMNLANSGFFCTDACEAGTCRPGCISPKHPERYDYAMAFIGGVGFENLKAIRGPVELPEVLSVIQHGSVFRHHAAARDVLGGWAAIPLERVVRFLKRPLKGQPAWRERYHDGATLRRACGLAPDTKLVLCCVAKDRHIEPVWRELYEEGFVDYFRRLNFAAVAVPNFSLFDRESRHQHEYNRKRSLIVAEVFTRFGIPVVPNFHALAPGDVEFWREFLRARPEIRFLGLEFQTGLGDDLLRAYATIDELARLQNELGRPLHLVAIGGSRFSDRIASRFASWTMVSSRPFMLAINGRRMIARASGAFGEAFDGGPPEKLFPLNHHVALVASRAARRRWKAVWSRMRHRHWVAGAQQLTLPVIADAAGLERFEPHERQEHPHKRAVLRLPVV